MEGKFGEEREIQIEPDEHTTAGRNKRGVFFDQLTCREHPFAPKVAGVAERRVSPLFLDHGILDVWGNQVDGRPIKVFSGDYGRMIDLPLPRRAIAPEKIYYSKYKQAYVLSGFTAPPAFSNPWGSWPKGVNQPVYLLSPKGDLILGGEIPWHDRYREALGVYFTVEGLVYAGGIEPDMGFFLVRDGKVTRLLKAVGWRALSGGGISPNGCKLAAAISMERANKSSGLKVINLCKGGER